MASDIQNFRYNLSRQLKEDEGFRKSAYKDNLGYWTIGHGRMIDAKLGGGISEEEADILLENDIIRTETALDNAFPWWRRMPPNPQLALANMCFQLGITKLKKFKETLSLLKQGLYHQAANSAMDSLWAKQTPNRAKRVTDLIRKVPL